MDIAAVLEESSERTGGDSDEEGEEAHDLAEAREDAAEARRAEGGDLEEDGDGEGKFVTAANPGAAASLSHVPPEWVHPAAKMDKGEPLFKDVYNPGNYHPFAFRPKFSGPDGAYQGHFLPAGMTPVPGDGKVGDWQFHYAGWEGDDKGRPNTKDELFPAERKGCLNAGLLSRLGLTSARMGKGGDKVVDALFFYQLLLPMGDPTRSGVLGDPRLPFYHDVEQFSNTYAFSIGLGGSYGHEFKIITLPELVRWDGVLVRDGVRGGSGGGAVGSARAGVHPEVHSMRVWDPFGYGGGASSSGGKGLHTRTTGSTGNEGNRGSGGNAGKGIVHYQAALLTSTGGGDTGSTGGGTGEATPSGHGDRGDGVDGEGGDRIGDTGTHVTGESAKVVRQRAVRGDAEATVSSLARQAALSERGWGVGPQQQRYWPATGLTKAVRSITQMHLCQGTMAQAEPLIQVRSEIVYPGINAQFSSMVCTAYNIACGRHRCYTLASTCSVIR